MWRGDLYDDRPQSQSGPSDVAARLRGGAACPDPVRAVLR
jgi:hypothetical protein